ncbi:MAG: LysR family transcriptional regulator [Paludibacterium sp.]|uniref:LysR family transcriptional regulator n=1 Tax=Paludibacterium sp. TaxID=1917523 RepID=UPI0025E3CFA4|nr:LysR family transcriptional regulator [Paludibacterium sp.]MBV8046436.1 LysR family transcriptional regulator [Paludibacterium sp.]MBV8647869.1 LysR family transcriptional regulator [Paludibacterium sp.]
MTVKFRTQPDWEDIRHFVALARHGSLSAAARALSVNHATVARRVEALETTLGCKLVERRPDGYVLTAQGWQILAHASRMEAAAGALSRGGAQTAVTGLVRINATPSLAQLVLVAWLAELAQEQPRLDLELASDVRQVSLERRETDIALRLDRPQDGMVIARPLAEIGFGFYALPAWPERLGTGQAPVFVGFSESHAHLPEAQWLQQHYPLTRLAVRADTQLAQAAAAETGVGIALLPHFVARHYPRLKPCALPPRPPSRPLWLVTRGTERNDPAVQTVCAFLAARFEREADRFA